MPPFSQNVFEMKNAIFYFLKFFFNYLYFYLIIITYVLRFSVFWFFMCIYNLS